VRLNSAGCVATVVVTAAIGFAPVPAYARTPHAAPTTTAAVVYSEARAINNRGDVVGWSSTDTGRRHAVLWRAGFGTYADAQDLGTLGGDNSWAYGINDLGEVVGTSEDSSGTFRAFLWTSAKGLTQLNGLPGAASCEASDINDRSQVVGTCTIASGTGYVHRPVLWTGGQAKDLDTGHPAGYAMGVNDRGEVFGSVDGELVLWSGSNRIHLGGTQTVSHGDVNDRSEVVGNWANSGSGHGRLFTRAPWGGYQETDLGAFAGDISSVYDINERGEATGESYTADSIHGFVWDQGTMKDIGTLGGPNSYAYSINDRGEVVGQSHLPSLELHAFVWVRGTMTDLGVLH